MKYILDVSKTNLSWSERAKNFKYLCKTGEHQLDYDLIECDIPKDIYAEIIKNKNGDTDLFPVGLSHIPVGATLTRVE